MSYRLGKEGKPRYDREGGGGITPIMMFDVSKPEFMAIFSKKNTKMIVSK